MTKYETNENYHYVTVILVARKQVIYRRLYTTKDDSIHPDFSIK